MSPAIINNATITKLNELGAITDLTKTPWQETINAPMDVDECFNSLATQWQQGNYGGIIEHCNTLPLDYLCDIRICVYYLYSAFWVHENISLVQLIDILTKLITQQQKTSTQESQRHSTSKIAGKSLGLFFRKVLAHLENSSKKSDNAGDPEQIIIAVDHLQQVISAHEVHLDVETEGLLIKTYQFFSNSVEQNHPTTENAQDQQQKIVATIQPENAKALTGNYPKIPQCTRNSLANTHSRIETSSRNHSYRLLHLFEKIQALHLLLDNEQDLKAAVVLADIQSELDNFNPLIYFPEYFSDFAGLRARYANRLEPLFAHHESYQWQVLNDYYHTDITAFVNSESEMDSEFRSRSFNDEHQYQESDTLEEAYRSDYDE